MKNTDLVQLLKELATQLHQYDSANLYHDAAPLIARARQAAEKIEGQPQDQQWYAYHPEDGMELFGTSDQAKAQAELWLADDRTAASTDGWHEDQELLAWGYIVPVESAQVTQRYAADETEEGCSSPDFDEYVVYELKPVPARKAAEETEGRKAPSRDDLMQILFDSFRGPIEFVCDTQEEGELMAKSHVKFALAMLARWKTPNLAEIRRSSGDAPQSIPVLTEGTQVIEPTERTLLVPVAQPIPVSEWHWKREGWCDADGECWWCPPDGSPYWQIANPAMVYGGWLLPHDAVPLPTPSSENVLEHD